MKKFIMLFVVIMIFLSIPSIAYSQEAPVETDQGVQLDSVKKIEVLNYIILITPADDENPVTLGVFLNNDENSEPITSFTLGGILGKSVSQLAHSVPPGPEHGKIVSSFVKEVNAQRKEQKRTIKDAKKTGIEDELNDEQEEDEDNNLKVKKEKTKKVKEKNKNSKKSNQDKNP